MKTLLELRKHAEEAAKLHGHGWVQWEDPVVAGDGRTRQYGYCLWCGLEVGLVHEPWPNEVEVSGPLVAEHCDPRGCGS